MKTKKNPIALNLPEVVALLILYGRHVVQSMTGNDWFPNPTPPLADVSEHLDKLELSQTTALSRAKGTAAARDVDLAIVEADLHSLKAYVAIIVAQNVASAAAIIASAGMSAKRYTRYDKPALVALMGSVPAEAVLRAKAAGRGAAYEWQVSSNGGQTWLDIGLTNVAETTLPGLTAGTTYLFRFRATVKNVTSAWSQVVSLFAH